ncbi:hypothetical protein L2E82_29531 [Cichorium intybus]|uniref:Uncharacterized protein n=1 Tax=Cichorium intybus TaxID=13427 RepID=A0ACB9CY74_CICIN|nr:hypothetical protein L2E82_29531 [Cichorium intybus]
MRRPEVMGSPEMVNAVGLDRRLLVTLPVQSKWQNSNWWSTFKKREGGKGRVCSSLDHLSLPLQINLD